jgi:pilus assembly protein CpaC
VRARAGISIACFCALSFAFCTKSALQAQAPSPLPQPAEVSSQDSANDLIVAVGKSVLVDCAKPIERVAVGSSDLAEATAVSPTEIMLNGKAAGETTLIVWQVGGARQFFNVTVHASSYAANDHIETLRRELRTEFPGQTLRVSSENGLIFLRGSVKDLNSSDRAVQIASTAGKVVNLLYVDVPVAEPQILLKVRFASVDRSMTKQLGINLFSTGAANSIGSVSTQQFSPPGITLGSPASGSTPATPTTTTLSSLLNLFIFRPDLNLGATIEALQTSGVVQILAEPNVLTANGKQGSFLAGGEFPYPVVQGTTGGGGTGAVTIQFQEFGVRLNFIPTITPRGTIRLQVAPEVSSLDFANGVTISGFTVPGIDVRRVKTEVELSEGQSFAIGGLLDNRDTKNFSKIPFLGDIPILGKFFQSISINKTNTELIVIVTPQIVYPIPATEPLPQLKYPDKFLPLNSNIPMTTPGPEVTGVKPPSPPRPTLPVEKLLESLQPEQPLVIDTSMRSSGGSSSSPTGPNTAPLAPAGPQ